MIRRILGLLSALLSGLRESAARAEAPVRSTVQDVNAHAYSEGGLGTPSQPMSPEEQLIRQSLPPSSVIESHVIARVGPNGQIPKRIESTQMTPDGPAVVRTEAVFLDDFGVAGRVENIKGVCAFCGRISFAARPCAVCGLCVCPGCGGEFQGDKQAVFLCRRHLRRAKWNAALWTDQTKSTGE